MDGNASGVYQIRNLRNGKRYVGSAVCFAHRWRQHRCELGKGRHNPKLQNSWRKHGEEALVFEIIEFVPDKERLIEREQHYLDALKPEYNVAVTAGSNFGIKWTDDVKRNMSSGSKEVWSRPGHREKMSEAHKGYKPSPESVEKRSEALRGRKLTEQHRVAVAARNAARNKSPEHRARMSDFWKGRPKTKEQLEKMATTKRGKPAHNRGKPMSDEQKAKQSAAMRAKYSDPQYHEKMRQANLMVWFRKKEVANNEQCNP